MPENSSPAVNCPLLPLALFSASFVLFRSYVSHNGCRNTRCSTGDHSYSGSNAYVSASAVSDIIHDNFVVPPLRSPSKSNTQAGSKHLKEDDSSSSVDSNEFTFLTPVNSSVSMVSPLVRKIDETAKSDVIVIGIAGGSGSGKTTLAKAIYESIGPENISLLSHDCYYKDLSHLPPKERDAQNFDHPDSLDTALLVEHVKALKRKETVNVPSYDFGSHTRNKECCPLTTKSVIMVEGILIFSSKELYNEIDIKIFVDTDDDIRLIRRIQRDTIERGRSLQGIVSQYVSTVRPMHLEFVEPSKRNADLIVPVGLNSVALDLVVSKLKAHLLEGGRLLSQKD